VLADAAELAYLCTRYGVVELVQVEHAQIDDLILLEVRVADGLGDLEPDTLTNLRNELTRLIGRRVQLVATYRSPRLLALDGDSFCRRVRLYPGRDHDQAVKVIPANLP